MKHIKPVYDHFRPFYLSIIDDENNKILFIFYFPIVKIVKSSSSLSLLELLITSFDILSNSSVKLELKLLKVL